MDVWSRGETVSVEDGMLHLAFDLAESDAAYLLISAPTDTVGDLDEFFGSDHYVEVKDQLFGEYGGLAALAVLNDCSVKLRLKNDVPGVGRELAITTNRPMADELMDHLRRLERV